MASPLQTGRCLCLKRREPAATRVPCRGVAQLVEYRSPKPVVAGSSPAAPASFRHLGVPPLSILIRWRRDVLPPYLDLLALPQYIAGTCCRPALTDIRRGFEFPRTIEPAWCSSFKRGLGARGLFGFLYSQVPSQRRTRTLNDGFQPVQISAGSALGDQ